jgi:hypothetical protein
MALPQIVANLLTLHPERDGLVKLLGAFVLLGYEVPLLANPPKPRELADDSYAAFCLLIRLARPISSELEAEELALSAQDLVASDSELINHISDLVIKKQKGKIGGSQLISRLLTNWPEDRWLSKGRAVAFLEGDIQDRQSLLGNPGHRAELGLPSLHTRA